MPKTIFYQNMTKEEAQKILQEYVKNLEKKIFQEEQTVDQLIESSLLFHEKSVEYPDHEKEYKQSAQDCIDIIKKHNANIEKMKNRIEAIHLFIF